MKTLFLVVTLLAISLNSFAMSSRPKTEQEIHSINSNCASTYVDGESNLRKAYNEFNSGYISNLELVGVISAISFSVTTKSALCRNFFEAPKYKTCVNALESRYKKIRSYAKTGPLLTGVQTEISRGLFDIAGEFGRGTFSLAACELVGIDTVGRDY